jgi:hypothetical protein
VDYLTLRLMLLDQPRYIPKKPTPKTETKQEDAQAPDDGSDIAEAFEAELKNRGFK